MTRPIVVITEPLDPAAVAWLGERCDLRHAPFEDARAVRAALAEAEALIVRTYTRVEESLLSSAPKLRIVARAGVGLDNIDQQACRAHKVAVISAPDANTSAVVEYVWSLIFGVVRPVEPLHEALTPSAWRTLRDSSLAPRELSELTLGILGLGRIGSRVASVASTLMGRVIAHDLLDIPPDRRAGAACVSRDELLASSDILTIHVDGRPSNRRLIARDECAALKPDVILLNSSRGFVVDASALAAFLKSRPHAVALLDVHDPEPIPPDSPLLALPNARLFPHLGAATVRAKRNMSGVVRRVWEFLEQPR